MSPEKREWLALQLSVCVGVGLWNSASIAPKTVYQWKFDREARQLSYLMGIMRFIQIVSGQEAFFYIIFYKHEPPIGWRSSYCLGADKKKHCIHSFSLFPFENEFFFIYQVVTYMLCKTSSTMLSLPRKAKEQRLTWQLPSQDSSDFWVLYSSKEVWDGKQSGEV